MAEKRIEVHRLAAAPPAVVFDLLADGLHWPDWSPLGSASMDRAGAPYPDGLGAIRRFRTGRVTSVEEVETFEPGERFGYRLLPGSSLPLRDYHADVQLTPVDGGAATEVRWRSTFRPSRPGTGWLYRAVLARFITKLVDGLAAEAARRAEAPAA